MKIGTDRAMVNGDKKITGCPSSCQYETVTGTPHNRKSQCQVWNECHRTGRDSLWLESEILIGSPGIIVGMSSIKLIMVVSYGRTLRTVIETKFSHTLSTKSGDMAL